MEKRCIIVSGGRPGPAPQPQPGDFVIACDRGYRYCAGLGLQPDLFIGDFDSYDGAVDPAVPVERLQPEKDDTDTGHAIRHALDQGYRTLLLVCALGGRLDHTLANLQLFAKFSERDVYVTAVADTYAVRLLTGPDVFELPALGGGTVSVFSANDMARGVIERGMEYSIDDEPLSNRTSRGLSNELTGEEATVAVEEGTLYVFYPLAYTG